MSEHNKRKESEGSSATKARGAEEAFERIAHSTCQAIQDHYGCYPQEFVEGAMRELLAAHNSATAADDNGALLKQVYREINLFGNRGVTQETARALRDVALSATAAKDDSLSETRCSICDWTNVGLLNLGDPGKPDWVCHGCIKREHDRLKSLSETPSASDQSYREAERIVDELIKERDDSSGDNIAGRENLKRAIDFAECGWAIIANAHGGNWELESKCWQEAAAKYRDEFHNEIRKLLPRSNDEGEANTD